MLVRWYAAFLYDMVFFSFVFSPNVTYPAKLCMFLCKFACFENVTGLQLRSGRTGLQLEFPVSLLTLTPPPSRPGR